MSRKGHITAVGLGPGDGDLITVKGLKALKQADIIFYPASSVSENAIKSFSLNILKQFDLDAPLEPLHIPMNSDQRELYYYKAFEQIQSAYKNNKNIVVVSEGDILFFSTFGYLWQHIQNAQLDCSIIPGIPAFIASGGLGSIPLVEGDNTISIIACPDTLEELQTQLKHPGTYVVMKLSKLKEKELFFNKLTVPFLYVEKAGTEEQFVTNRVEEVIERASTYFSLLIIYNYQ